MPTKHYTHLSLAERIIIENRLINGELPVSIARSLGRSRSTITRELKRNGLRRRSRVNRPKELHMDSRHFRGTETVDLIRKRKDSYRKRQLAFSGSVYHAVLAERRAKARTKHQSLILEQGAYVTTRAYVLEKLKLRWSPEQISGRLEYEEKLPHVSHAAIYAFIQEHSHLHKYLRRKGRKYRHTKAQAYNTTPRQLHSIDDRPKIIDERKRTGDLEGDTIFGKDTRDRLLTHADRKTGLLSVSLVYAYDAQKIRKRTASDIRRIFGKDIHSITYDNGSEFNAWQQLELDTGTTVYFAHPYHSWERGTNENTNGLIRDFFPKGTDFKKLRQQDILRVESLLNNRPRKRLNWLTPIEAYEQSKCCT